MPEPCRVMPRTSLSGSAPAPPSSSQSLRCEDASAVLSTRSPVEDLGRGGVPGWRSLQGGDCVSSRPGRPPLAAPRTGGSRHGSDRMTGFQQGYPSCGSLRCDQPVRQARGGQVPETAADQRLESVNKAADELCSRWRLRSVQAVVGEGHGGPRQGPSRLAGPGSLSLSLETR